MAALASRLMAPAACKISRNFARRTCRKSAVCVGGSVHQRRRHQSSSID